MLDQTEHGELVREISLRADGRAPLHNAESAGVDEYDDYFRIKRDSEVDDSTWWSDAFRVARHVVTDLTDTRLDDQLCSEIMSGICRLLLAGRLESVQRESAEPRSATLSEHRLAARRWKLGHHLFHHLLSLMNSYVDQLVVELEADNWVVVEDLLQELAVLYDAATATMHYASDFPPAVYEATVRPSMEPPWMPSGFSGMFNQEHTTLLDRIGEIKPQLRGAATLANLPDPVVHAAKALWKAQSRNRREHKLICAKFVPEGDSLLQQHFDETHGKD